jgi:hypothetical protein
MGYPKIPGKSNFYTSGANPGVLEIYGLMKIDRVRWTNLLKN